ncbi:S-Ena type endospore appendage [Bacillus manliponensis]
MNLSNRKRIGCFAPLGMNCYPPSPPLFPPPKPIETELITNEFCGNFLVTDQPLPSRETLELWQRDETSLITGTVSIYNSSNSTHPVSIQIIDKIAHQFIVFPGNTTSFTGNALQSISIIDIPNDSPLYIEGKYCCQFTYCRKKMNCM